MKDSLKFVYDDLISFLTKESEKLDRPIEPSIEKILKIQNDIKNDYINNDLYSGMRFYQITQLNGVVSFSHNIEKYLDTPKEYTLIDIYKCISGSTGNVSLVVEYLSWARAAYILSEKVLPKYNARKFSYKIRVPMKLRDGYVYWIQQDSRPFELDRMGRMVSNLNIYTVICRYNEISSPTLLAEIYYEELYNEKLSKTISEIRIAAQAFELKPIQKDILFFFHNNPIASIRACASELKYPLNTIKKYISDSQRKQGIMDMAKVSFPSVKISKLKDVVAFLDKIGWYD